jgi:hypothetical protein
VSNDGAAEGCLSTVVTLVVALLVIILMMAWLDSCRGSADAAFRDKCLREHPTAHFERAGGYSSRTRYCLGPNGEVWDVG